MGVYLGIAQDKLPLIRAIVRKFELDEPPHQEDAESPMLQALAQACPPNLTGADVSVLCTDAYTLAQKEHIKLLDEVADAARVSISTLLLFFDALERTSGTTTHSNSQNKSSCMFTAVFPIREELEWDRCVFDKVPTGLALYQCRQKARAFVLVHHTGVTDNIAAVIFDPSPAEHQVANAQPLWEVRTGPLECKRCCCLAGCGGVLENSTTMRGLCP